jgi:hypothetical protein
MAPLATCGCPHPNGSKPVRSARQSDPLARSRNDGSSTQPPPPAAASCHRPGLATSMSSVEGHTIHLHMKVSGTFQNGPLLCSHVLEDDLPRHYETRLKNRCSLECARNCHVQVYGPPRLMPSLLRCGSRLRNKMVGQTRTP